MTTSLVSLATVLALLALCSSAPAHVLRALSRILQSSFPRRGHLVSRILLLAAACLSLAPLAQSQTLFGPSKNSSFISGPVTVRCDVADVDQDGTLDLVFTMGSSFSWRKGNGQGVFGAGVTLPDLAGTFIHTVDLNGDGRRDVLAASLGPTMQVALAQDAGGFGTPVNYSLPVLSVSGRSLGSGDADGDGDMDVLVVTQPTSAQGGEARLFLNDGAGTLMVGPIVTGTQSVTVVGAQAGSIDGNAEPDLVVTTQGTSSIDSTVWLGQPGGGVLAGATVPGLTVSRIADLDNDGDADLLAPTTTLLEPVFVHTFLGDGTGGFVAGASTDLGLTLFGAVSADVADFDSDGVADLAVAVPGTPPEAWMLHGDGTGAFDVTDAHVSLLPSAGPTSAARLVALSDLDNDGRLDVLALLPQTFQAFVAASLNATYPVMGPLLDLGHQLRSATTGCPIQIVSGSFVGGTPFSFALANGPFSGSVYHVVGLSVINAPFKGGTMVPMPNLLSGPWPTTSTGTLNIAGNWPMGVPSGFQIAAQFWFASPAVAGFAASSGVQIITP